MSVHQRLPENNNNGVVISSIELCAGIGMLGEGVRAAFEFFGWQHRTVCFVEREAPAAAQLVALMESECLDAAPVYSDMLTFRGRDWRGKVDCVIAGFPCQDLSVAGKRAGLDGKRSGLFFNVLDVADDCGAWLLILENVAGIASAAATVMDEAEGELEERAVSRVLGELADRGWHTESLTLSASDVGASHGRERWFCLAWREVDNSTGSRRDGAGQRTATNSESGQRLPCAGQSDMGNTNRNREAEIGVNAGEVCSIPKTQCEPKHSAAVLGGSGRALANTSEPRLQKGWGKL